MTLSELIFFWATVIFGLLGLIFLVLAGVHSESIYDLVKGRDSLTLEQEKERSRLFAKEEKLKGGGILFLLFAGISFSLGLVSHFNP